MAQVIRSILNKLLFPFSLRWRLTHLYGAFTTALFIAVLAAMILTYRLGVTSLADRTLRQAADAAVDIVENEAITDLGRIKSRLGELSEGYQSLFLSLEDAGGASVLYESDPDLSEAMRKIPHPSRLDSRVRLQTVRRSNRGALRTATLFIPVAGNGFWIHLAIPLPSLLGLFTAWQVYGAVFFFLVLVLALAWIGWFVAGEALRPIQDIAEVARRVSRGGLHERIPHPGKRDDVSRLVETLNEMLDRLEGTTERLHQFTANISHQLKTPLTIMRGEIEVALRSEPQVPELRAVLESSLSELEDLSNLVQHMLAYARVETEAKESPAPARVDKLVSELVRKAAVLTRGKNVALDLKAEPVTAILQPVRFEQALLNILDNAIKYTPPGGRILLEVGSRPDQAWVRVQDSGPGLTPEELENLFKRGSSRTSTGVGLALARALVESFMGTLEITSAPGQGVTVRLSLPAGPDSQISPTPTQILTKN